MNSVRPTSTETAVLHHIQHSAYRCRDAEQTRWFYEDVLGLPLVAALSLERDEADGEYVEYMHLFFEMGDGNHIAFFDEPAHAAADAFEKKHGFDMHVAFEVPSAEALELWRLRLTRAGVQFSTIDHGFLHSHYFYDPNGIRLEITLKTAAYEPHMKLEKATCHQKIAEWSKRTQPLKTQKFGAGATARQTLTPDLPSLGSAGG